MRCGRWDIPSGGLWDTTSGRGLTRPASRQMTISSSPTGESAVRTEGDLDEFVELMRFQVEIDPLDPSTLALYFKLWVR